MNTQNEIVMAYQLPADSASITGNRKPLSSCIVALIVSLMVSLLLPQVGAAQTSFPPVTINLSYPQYQSLKLDGGYMYINESGMQGVILYRLNETTYLAFERQCSIEDEAPVSIDGSGLFMKGCNSTYSFSDGFPTGGAATRPLLKYRTSLTGQTLLITDEVAY